MGNEKKVSEEFTVSEELIMQLKKEDDEHRAKLSRTVLTSGRFDPPHAGHIIHLQKLMADFSSVKIVVLAGEKQEFPVIYRVQVLEEALSRSNGKFEIVVNLTHFGEIGKEEFAGFGTFDCYAGGNLDVLKHLEGMEVPCIYRPREFEYAATDQRLAENLKKMLK